MYMYVYCGVLCVYMWQKNVAEEILTNHNIYGLP